MCGKYHRTILQNSPLGIFLGVLHCNKGCRMVPLWLTLFREVMKTRATRTCSNRNIICKWISNSYWTYWSIKIYTKMMKTWDFTQTWELNVKFWSSWNDSNELKSYKSWSVIGIVKLSLVWLSLVVYIWWEWGDCQPYLMAKLSIYI